MWKEREMKNWQSSDAEKMEGKRRKTKKTENCAKRDLERVRGEWRTTAKDRRSWRLLIENVVRENR